MSLPIKLATALTMIAGVAACVPAGGNDRVDTTGEIAATTDTPIGNQNVPGPGGVPVRP